MKLTSKAKARVTSIEKKNLGDTIMMHTIATRALCLTSERLSYVLLRTNLAG